MPNLELLRREVTHLRTVHHPYIIDFQDVFLEVYQQNTRVTARVAVDVLGVPFVLHVKTQLEAYASEDDIQDDTDNNQQTVDDDGTLVQSPKAVVFTLSSSSKATRRFGDDIDCLRQTTKALHHDYLRR